MATGYYFVSVSNFVWDFGNFNLVRNFIQINIDKINKVIQHGKSIKKKKKKKKIREKQQAVNGLLKYTLKTWFKKLTKVVIRNL